MISNDETEDQRIRTLVVDDQRLMRDGIASLLEIQAGITVVGIASNGQEALEKALNLLPDVILMDVRMPVMDGVVATRQICQQLPDCRILMLTTFDDDEYIVGALQAGASGYLLKDLPAPDLASAVRAVHNGIYQLDPTIAGKVIAFFSRPPISSPLLPLSSTPALPPPTNHAPASSLQLSKLTGREIEVLCLIAKGATNREIAGQLTISEGTVKNHISNILSRLGLRDRTQAAIYAQENGLL
jgi:DNA-binding NarL/FixJ family response regulator